MIAKLAAFFAAPMLVSASLPETITYTYHPDIVMVQCADRRGTAFRVGSRAFYSVNHVTSARGCMIDGMPVTVTFADKGRDFSVLRVGAEKPGGIKPNCGGFVDGEIYYAVGHARGEYRQRMVAVRYSSMATKMYPWREFGVLIGAEAFIPGMSGGPVLTVSGEVVGTINGYSPITGVSFSQPLSGTAVCTGHA